MMKYEEVKALDIPVSPGSYQFLASDGEIIYIGKAANLRSRVLSYWQKSSRHTPAKTVMLSKVAKINWIEVGSEVEALLLEANLIKKHQPRYNIALKDDKRHIYIKISTEEEWPRIFITRKVDQAGRYFGPFVSAEAVTEVLKVLRRLWPYRSCPKLPKKACLYYRLGKCPAPCEEKIGKKEYSRIIANIEDFLENGRAAVLSALKKELLETETELKEADLDSRESVTRRIDILKFRLLSLDKILADANILSLADKFSSDIVELAKVLSLPKIPSRIEGYDISNIFGQEAVGSMVVFIDGESDRSEYRKFKIRLSEDKGNDTMMLKEVLTRRFVNHGETSEEAWSNPDLLIIDGGKGQLNAASSILKKLGLDIPLLAVSKGEGLRSAAAPDKIFFPGQDKPLILSLASPALHIIKRVRDESHRFAIKYHRDLKLKKIRSGFSKNKNLV